MELLSLLESAGCIISYCTELADVYEFLFILKVGKLLVTAFLMCLH